MSDLVTPLTRLTGAQILVEYLVRQGVPFAAGVKGKDVAASPERTSTTSSR